MMRSHPPLLYKLTFALIVSSVAVLLLSTVVFSVVDVPAVVSSFRTWLRPPYLYLLINCIILTIAASSRLHHHHNHISADDFPPKSIPPMYESDHHDQLIRFPDAVDFDAVKANPPMYDLDIDDLYDGSEDLALKDVEVVDETMTFGEETAEAETSAPWTAGFRKEEEPAADVVEEPESVGDFRLDSADNVAGSADAAYVVAEKPSVVSRFANNRRPVRPGAEGGKALRVSRPRKQETLETTWKTITEGRHMPLTRHLKKSDTFDSPARQIMINPPPPPPEDTPTSPGHKAARKSKTFTDRGGARLRKEPSLGQDELNRRVEAFINKFNEEMRLQRQKSLQQFMEMINRAA